MKGVVYTTITDGHDELKPHDYRISDMDYICFSDDLTISSNFWEIRPLIYPSISKYKLSRYPKISPYKLLSEYDYSLCIDANINITSDRIERRVEELIAQNILMAIRNHPDRDCTYKEANECIRTNLDKRQTILDQVNHYKVNGFPEEYGLFETNLVFRRHMHPKVIAVSEKEWELYKKYSRRDQLSLMYTLWLLDFKCESFFDDYANIRNSEGLEYRLHKLPRSVDRAGSLKRELKKIYFRLKKYLSVE